jgi:hypothetical protein
MLLLTSWTAVSDEHARLTRLQTSAPIIAALGTAVDRRIIVVHDDVVVWPLLLFPPNENGNSNEKPQIRGTMAKCCTCAPHPFLDLTAAYHSPDGVGGQSIETIQKQLLDACRSHGCFHGCIKISQEDMNNAISSLAKPIESIERDIESLFASVSEDERDGGMFVVPFPESTLKATFRGRIAESGDPIQYNLRN